MPDPRRYPPFDVDALADKIGAALHPAHTRWVRDKTHPDGGYEAPVSAQDGDSSTMTVFTASDGYRSMRSLTWREVVQIVHDALADNDPPRSISGALTVDEALHQEHVAWTTNNRPRTSAADLSTGASEN